jgi:hypothetical protein
VSNKAKNRGIKCRHITLGLLKVNFGSGENVSIPTTVTNCRFNDGNRQWLAKLACGFIPAD